MKSPNSMTRRTVLVATCALVTSPMVTTQPASAAEKVKIGLSVQLDLQIGRDGRDGLNLAIKDINKQGGILGRQVEAVVVDETASPESAANSVRKLLFDDKVEALFYGTSSGNVLASLPAVADAEKVAFIVGAASPAIMQKVADDYDTYKYLFRLSINSDHQAKEMVAFVKDVVVGQLGRKKIAILADNSKWAQEVTAALQANAAGIGATVAAVETVAPDTLDYTTPLARIAASGAEFMITVLTYAKSDVLAKEFHDTKFPMLYGGMDSQAMDNGFFGRVNGKNVSEITAVFGGRFPITDKTLPYFDAFHKEYGRDPGYQSWFLDSALRVYKQAVEAAGSFDADKVIKQLEKISYTGPGGTIQWDERHEIRYGAGLSRWYFTQWMPDGSRSPVYPSELRTKDIIKPAWQK